MPDERNIRPRLPEQGGDFRRLPPRSEIELKEDSGLGTLARFVLAGSTIAVGLRHMPRGEVIKFQSELGKYMGRFKSDISEIIGFDLSKIYQTSSFNNPPVSWLNSKSLGGNLTTNRPEFIDDSVSLIDFIENSALSGEKGIKQIEARFRGLADESIGHLTRNNQNQVRAIRLGEFIDSPSMLRHTLSSPEQVAIKKVHGRLIGAIKDKYGAKYTDTADTLVRNITLDRGLFKAAGESTIYDTRAVSVKGLSKITQGLSQYKLPFLGFSPLDLAKPKTWWSPRYMELRGQNKNLLREQMGRRKETIAGGMYHFGKEIDQLKSSGAEKTTVGQSQLSRYESLHGKFKTSGHASPGFSQGQTVKVDDVFDTAFYAQGSAYVDVHGGSKLIDTSQYSIGALREMMKTQGVGKGGVKGSFLGWDDLSGDGYKEMISDPRNRHKFINTGLRTEKVFNDYDLFPVQGGFAFEQGAKYGFIKEGETVGGAALRSSRDIISKIKQDISSVEKSRSSATSHVHKKSRQYRNTERSMSERGDLAGARAVRKKREDILLGGRRDMHKSMDESAKLARGLSASQKGLANQLNAAGGRSKQFVDWFDGLMPGVGFKHARDAPGENFEVGLRGAFGFLRDVAHGARPQIKRTKDGLRFNVKGGKAPSVVTKSRSGLSGEYYGAKKGDVLDNVGTYMLNRTTRLMENMFGIGIAPGKNTGETFVNTFTKLVIPSYAAFQGVKYADFKTEEATGFSPINAAIGLYETGRLAVQGALDYSGVQDVAQYFEDLMPGMVNSPLSQGARSAASLYIGAMSGSKAGMALGVAGAAIGLTDITQTVDSLKRVYEGEELVPIRKSRYWALGRDPFDGGKVDYYRPNWNVMAKSNYKEKSIYGSQKEYWEHGSWMPTLENWFGLKHFTDPYYLEEKNYHSRPYPVSGRFGKDIPLVGPLISETIGKIVKPVVRMHQDYWRGDALQTDTPYYGPRGFGEVDYQALGHRNVNFNRQAYDPSSTGSFIASQGDKGDYFGFYNFMGGFMKNVVTGSNDFSSRRVTLASADIMDSASRDYYDKSLGGMLGYTELFRRFVVNDKKARLNTVNPIRNEMPAWLPGKASQFDRDKDFYLDFHLGDSFTKIAQGEARLPGTGYEELHRLHSGAPGIYDPVDRLMILSDVAPHSQAFKHYEAIVDAWSKSGVIDDYWTKKVLDSKRMAENISKERFSSSKFNGLATTLRGRPDHISALADENEYLKEREYNLLEKVVGNAWQGFKGSSSQIGAAMGLAAGGAGGMLYGTALGGMVENKWMPGNDAISDYEKFQFISRKFSDWNSPIDNFIAPYARNLMHGVFNNKVGRALTGGYTPGHVGERRDIESYYDEVKYQKYNRLRQNAMDNGDSRLANKFSDQMKSTMLYVSQSASAGEMSKYVYSAIPKTERAYFEQFSAETDESKRARILSLVPDYMGAIYSKMWNNQKVERGHSKDVVASNIEVSLSGFDMPDNDWAGWHPAVDLQYAKVKTMHNEGLDIHDAGLWEMQLDAGSAIPDMWDPYSPLGFGNGNIHESTYRNLRNSGFSGVQPSTSYSYGGNESAKITVNYAPDYQRDAARNMFGSFFSMSYDNQMSMGSGSRSF